MVTGKGGDWGKAATLARAKELPGEPLRISQGPNQNGRPCTRVGKHFRDRSQAGQGKEVFFCLRCLRLNVLDRHWLCSKKSKVSKSFSESYTAP